MDGQAGLHVAVAQPGSLGYLFRAGVAVGLAACGDSATVITPVVDIPANDDQDATAAALDEITLKIAHAGSDRDLVTQTFRRGEALEMPGAPFGDDLVLHMAGFIGSSNIAYGRTCAINVSPSTTSPQPHLFFSRTVKFANLDLAPLARVGGLGIPYLGTGLLVGGKDDVTNEPVTQVERFDPLTGQLTGSGTVAARDGAVYALLGKSPPRVLVLGGVSGGAGATSVEVLDGHTVEHLDFTATARVDLTATSLTDGRVIVIGGKAPDGPPVADIVEIAEADQAIDVRTLNARLANPRRGHTATRLGEDVGAPVLITGGLDASGAPIAVAELFKPLSEELASSMAFHPTLKVPRYGHAATLMPDGSVLIIGGLDALGQPVRTLELFSIDAGFATAGELPENAGVVELAAIPLPDGRILITGGRPAPGAPPTDAAYIIRLDLLNGQVDVVATDHMELARAGHQAIVLCDGTVLVSGGTQLQQRPERYNPPALDRR
jgi:hypothetical protein